MPLLNRTTWWTMSCPHGTWILVPDPQAAAAGIQITHGTETCRDIKFQQVILGHQDARAEPRPHWIYFVILALLLIVTAGLCFGRLP